MLQASELLGDGIGLVGLQGISGRTVSVSFVVVVTVSIRNVYYEYK